MSISRLRRTQDNYLLKAKQPSLSPRCVRFTPEILNIHGAMPP